MKVILHQTVPKLGKQGQIVNVADGYARNYLFPRGMAVLADKAQLAAYERRKVKLDAKHAETRAEAESIKAKLDGKSVKIEGHAGKESTKLFGAVTSQDVADAIKDQLGIELEKKQIGILLPIKRLGNHEIEIDLHRDVDAKVIVEIFDPTQPIEIAAANATPSKQGDEAPSETAEPAAVS